MKFLLFNLVVGAALVFLFAGDRFQLNDPANTVPRTAEQARETAEDFFRNIEQRLAPETSEQGSAPLAPPPLMQDPEAGEPVNKPVQAENNTNGLARAPVETAAAVETLSPDVARRRQEILAPETLASPSAAPDGTGLSETRLEERRNMLLDLAQDMELFSLDALSR